MSTGAEQHRVVVYLGDSLRLEVERLAEVGRRSISEQVLWMIELSLQFGGPNERVVSAYLDGEGRGGRTRISPDEETLAQVDAYVWRSKGASTRSAGFRRLLIHGMAILGAARCEVCVSQVRPEERTAWYNRRQGDV